MIINANYTRQTRALHNKTRIESKNKAGIVVDKNLSGPDMRKELLKHKPDGNGWVLSGYVIIEE